VKYNIYLQNRALFAKEIAKKIFLKKTRVRGSKNIFFTVEVHFFVISAPSGPPRKGGPHPGHGFG
jgi:hypothetical protein